MLSPTDASTSPDQMSADRAGLHARWKQPAYKWAHTLQTHAVQGSVVTIMNSLTNGITDNINVFFFQILQVTEHNTLKDNLEINFVQKLSFEFFTENIFLISCKCQDSYFMVQ